MQYILVTGSSGGLGVRVCEMLAAEGTTVFATDMARSGLRRLEGNPLIRPLLMDVTRSGDLSRVRRRIAGAVDGLDGIVCCAGIFAASPLVETSEREMRRILDVNFMGAFLAVREFFPLLKRPGGTIVLIGSESSRCAMPFNGPYTVSKTALQAYADSLRRELMLVGVRVVLVMPGAIRTPLLAGARETTGQKHPSTLFAAQRGLVHRMLVKEYGKAMDPSRVAAVVARALHARRPRHRYHVGNDPLRALLGRLPSRWVDALIRLVAARP
jgi:NAD(P)-dependent dehydrogenase (short-subunit alcohol dehydrogenase family)